MTDQRWIFVTDRLPKGGRDNEVLVTRRDEYGSRMTIPAVYHNGKWGTMEMGPFRDQFAVLAWIPMPEPWND